MEGVERAREGYPVTVEFGRANRSEADRHWIGIHLTPASARAVLYNVDQPLRSWIFSSMDYAIRTTRTALYTAQIDQSAERTLVLEDGVWHREHLQREHA